MWIDFQLAPLRDAEGGITHLIPSTIDITAHRRAEAPRRQSEGFHRQALESIPGMVFTTSPDGWCDYQSQQWADNTRIPVPEHLGDGARVYRAIFSGGPASGRRAQGRVPCDPGPRAAE